MLRPTRWASIAFLTAAAALPRAAGAETYVLPAQQDTWLQESSLFATHGADAELFSLGLAGDRKRPLLQFDLSAVPSSAVVTSAQLFLYVTDSDGSGSPTQVFRNTALFSEGSASWLWNAGSVDTTVAWGTIVPAQMGWIGVEIGPLVQAWIDGTHPNFGLRLLTASTGDESAFASREHATAEWHPRLFVQTSGGSFRIASGTYTGDKSSSRSIKGVPFDPDIVIVKQDGALSGVVRTATMSGTDSKWLGTNDPMAAGSILSLDAGGFTIGPDDEVNAAGVTHHWTAFRADGSTLSLGMYAGTGADDVDIKTGAAPEVAVLVAEDNVHPAVRFALQPADECFEIQTGGTRGNLIQDFLSDGFRIGDDNGSNGQGTLFHWIAWHTSPGAVAGGRYTGDGTTDRSVLSGFAPSWALVRADDSGGGLVHRSDGMTGDFTLPLFAGVPFAEGIKSLKTDGLSVGNDDSVNKVGTDNYWAAFSSPTAADLTLTKAVDDSTADPGQTLDFTLQLDNAGPDSATGVQVTDVLPADLVYQFATPSQGSYSSGTGVWDVGAVAAGESATLTITADVSLSPSAGSIVNVAQVTATLTPDPAPGDEADSVTVTVPGTDLGVSVTAFPVAAAEGDTVLFTVDLENHGAGIVAGVAVDATLPTGLSHADHSQTAGTYNPGQERWNVGTVIGGATETLSFYALVEPGTAGSSLSAAFTISAADQPDPVPGNDADSASVTIAAADLRVTKTVDNPNPAEGDSVRFDVRVLNLGPDDAASVDVADLLPAGLVFVSDSLTQGLYTPGTGIWNVGTIAAGDSADLVVQAAVQPGTAGTTRVNVASRSASTPTDSNASNDADSSAVLVQGADLDLQMTVDDATPVVGQGITFTLTLGNLGPDSTTAVAVTDVLPDSLTYNSSVASQGNYAPGTGIWSVGTVAAGSTAVLDLTAVVDTSAIGTSFPNTAAVTATGMADPFPGNNADTVMISVLSADIQIAAGVDVPNPAEGDTVVVTIGTANAGPDDVTGLTVSYLPPAGLTYVSDSEAGRWNPGTGVWTIDALGALSAWALQVTLVVDPGTAGATLLNAASIATVDQSDPVASNNAATAMVTVQSADLAVLAGVDDASPDEGQSVQLSVRVTNEGPNDATGVEASDPLPAGLTYVSDTPAQGSYNPGTGVWTVGAVAAGDSALLTITASVDPGTGGSTLTNTAWRSASFPGDDAAANDTSSVTMTVGAADLAVTKSVSQASIPIGSTVSYTVQVNNLGPNDATSVVASDSLPSRVDYQSDAPTQGTYDEVTGLWDIGTIAAGDSATLLLTGTVNTGPIGTLVTNTAQTVSADQGDSGAANNTDSASFVVLGVVPLAYSDLAITKTSLSAVADVGDTVQFRVEVENRGPDLSGGTTVTDLLPPGLAYVSDTPSQGTYNSGNGRWTLAVIAVGDTASLDLFAEIAPGAAASIQRNTATITAAVVPDSVSGNNTDRDSVAVLGADLSLAIAVDNPAPDEGDTLRFTIDLANAGPDGDVGVVVADLLPAGLTYQSDAPEQGTYNSGTGNWSVGAIVAGDTLSLDLWATVDPGAAGGTYTHVVSLTGRTRGDPDPSNDADSVAVSVPAVDLAVRKTADRSTADEGDAIRFTVTLTNAGPDAATGVSLNDPLPAGLSHAADSVSQGSYVAGTGAWTVGTIAAGDSATLFLDATADSGTAGSTLTNTAALAAFDQTDTDPTNREDSASVRILAADLGVAHAVSDSAAQEGSSVDLTTILTNAGPDSTAGVQVAAALPAGLSLVTHSADRGTWTDSTGVWIPGTMAPGDTVTLVVTATVDPGTAGTTIPTSAAIAATSVTDPNGTNDSASAAINVPDGILVTASQTSVLAVPGQADVAMMTLSIVNSHAIPVTLNALTLTNASLGPGTVAQMDASLGTVTLYQDDGDFAFEPLQDVALGTTALASGTGTVGGLTLTLPAGSVGTFHLGADLSLVCRDGDRLDLSLAGPGSLAFAEAVTHLTTWPVSPAGRATIDGMSAAQIAFTPLGSRSVTAGTPGVVVADFSAPANGYATDTLSELRFVNLGTAQAGTDIASLDVWSDGGDGTFDAGLVDDKALGAAIWGGTSWNLIGLSEAIPTTGLPLWVTASFAVTGAPGATLNLGLAPSPTGIRVSSNNDGPVDRTAKAPDTFTIQPPASAITVTAVQSAATLAPDSRATTDVFQLELVNTAAVAETLTTLTFTNATAGPGNQGQLDADWTSLSLLTGARSSILAQDGSGVRKAGLFSGGRVTFSSLGVAIAPGDTVVAVLTGGATTGARDGDLLDVLVADPADIGFADSTVQVNGSWPLDPAGSFPVDGLVSAQVSLRSGLPPSLLTGSVRNVAWSAVLPSNGYETDTLQALDVVNLGSATHGADISGMELWCDFDLDGTAEPLTDDAPGLLGTLVYTGQQWEITGLAKPLPPGGVTLFATVNIADQAQVGAGVQLSVPVNGIGVKSTNDGPLDAALTAPLVQTISTSDRVTLGSTVLSPGSVAPGAQDVPLLSLSFTNDYGIARTINRITVTNGTTGPGAPDDLDTEAGLLHLRADSLNAPDLATAIFTNGQAAFSGLAAALAPGGTRAFFVVADVSQDQAADGDVLGASIADEAAVSFASAATLVGSWPISSDAAWTVDGMVAAQITEKVAPPATLGPGEGPALALDVVLPSNGYQADILRGLTVVNHGSAVAGDIDQMRLWRDGGDGAFDAGAGDDTALGPMSPIAGEWTSPALASALPVGGGRYFVSVTSSPALVDGTTVQLAIPVNGVTVESGNDGPRDAFLENDEVLLFSTAALLAALDIAPNSSTLSDVVTVTMTVRNLGDSTITGITPSALVPDAPGVLGVVSGPTPSTLDLVPDGQASFVWSYSADAAGVVRLTGSASGTEQGTGLTRQSLDARSDLHRVYLQAQELELFPVESMPFSINRGQTDVVPLSLTLTNNAADGGSDIELLGLRIRLADGSGAGVVPAELLSRVVVNEGTNVYLDKTSLEAVGDTLDLTLATPVLIPATSQVTLSLSLDIADSTVVPEFRITIPNGNQPWFVARDATSLAPASILLSPSASYPVQSGLARIVSEATQLDVSAAAGTDVTVGQGQAGVRFLDLQFWNPDPDSLAADVRISAFDVVLTDSNGTAVPQPSQVLSRIRATAGFLGVVDRTVSASEDSTMTLTLSPLVSVPVNNAVTLFLDADLATGAPLGTYRLRLADSTGFDARDANTGTDIPVVYQTDPVRGPAVTVVTPADSVYAAGTPRLPAILPVGSQDVPALRIAVRHPGGAATGPVDVDALTVLVRDAVGAPLVPATYVDRARVLRDSVEVGLITGTPGSGGSFTIDLTGVTVPAGTTDTLELRFDVEVTAPVTPLRLDVAPAGLAVRDAALGTPVGVGADSGATFPLTSGVTQLTAPAREVIVGFSESMPPVLAAHDAEVTFAGMTLTNPADATAGDVTLDRLTVRATDGEGTPLALGAALTAVEAWVDGALWAASADIDPTDEKAEMVATVPWSLAPQAPGTVELRARIRPGTDVTSLRLGVDHPDIGVVQPPSSLLTIAVTPAPGQAFPFWTQAGNFSSATLEESWSNFPNPFAAGRSETKFAFFLPQAGRVTLKLYTARGAVVRTLLDRAPLPAGLHQDRVWDGRNGAGATVTNGVYLAEISVSYADGSLERYLRKVAVVR